jgi:hypothetical protein
MRRSALFLATPTGLLALLLSEAPQVIPYGQPNGEEPP